MRVILDTNVLIDAASDDYSPQARLIEAVIDGEISAAYTPAMEREYRKIMSRLINDQQHHDLINDFLATAAKVEPATADVQIDDADDRKFIAAALGAKADAIVTNDRHLLDVGEIEKIKVMTPEECWSSIQDDFGNSDWQNWVEGLGL